MTKVIFLFKCLEMTSLITKNLAIIQLPRAGDLVAHWGPPSQV